MKIKNYNLFKESKEDYSIIDFYYDLHPYSKKNINLEYYSEIFLGKGIYKRISEFVDKMFETFEGIDLEDIELKLTEITDYIEGVNVDIYFSILNCNWKESEEDVSSKFNGASFLHDDPKKHRNRIIKYIIRDIIHPTIGIFQWKNNLYLRTTNEEIYVLDEKYNCKNFDITNFAVYNTNEFKEATRFGDEIFEYNIERFFECYAPAIYIDFNPTTAYKEFVVLKDIESRLDEVLPRIFHYIPYKEIIWDFSRFTRRFEDTRKINEYKVKVILK